MADEKKVPAEPVIDGAVRVNTGPVDRVGGALPEPEELPAEELRALPVNITVGHGPMQGEVIAIGEQQAILEGTAGDFAENVSRECRFCAHFRTDLWAKLRAEWGRGSATDQKKLNEIRAAIMENTTVDLTSRHAERDGTLAIEHMMGQMGLCEAFSAIFKEEIIVHPVARCPQEGPNYEIIPCLFKPRDRSAQREASSARDAFLRAKKFH
jgi:hypothetical protein